MEPRAKPDYTQTAELRSVPRRRWCLLKKRRLTCPAGHHFAERADFPESGFFRCEHWIEEEKRECGLWVFLLAVRGGGCFVFEVDLREKREMDEISTPAEMIAYLGVFPDRFEIAHSVPRPRATGSHHPDHHRRG